MSGGTGGGSSSAGGSTGAGGSAGNAGGTGGTSKDAGPNDASAGSGGQTTDSGLRDAKVDAADSGPLSITVTGTVIDVLRRPYAGVPVAIGTTLTTTDAQGRFQVSGVTPPYDVALHLTDPLVYGWYFVGLTTPSPVLQVETRAPPPWLVIQVTLNIANAPAIFPPANEHVSFAWGSSDGWDSRDVTGPAINVYPDWTGPSMSVGPAHVLAWMLDAGNLPTTYVGYDTTSLPVKDQDVGDFSLDLTKTHPGTAAVSGSFALGTLGTPHIDAYVTLPKSAFIQIASEDRAATNKNFTYNVPTGITGAGFMVCAQAGSSNIWPFSVAHRRGISAAQTGIALTVPDAASVVAPGNNETVSTSTDFSWSPPSGQQGPVLYTLGLAFGNSLPYQHVRIVTSKTTARIPKFPAAFGPIVTPSVSGGWWVETNGSFTSVDAAATASGFVDPFDNSAGVVGLLDQDGTHTWSASRSLMTSATP
jgi:hypothetical protein